MIVRPTMALQGAVLQAGLFVVSDCFDFGMAFCFYPTELSDIGMTDR